MTMQSIPWKNDCEYRFFGLLVQYSMHGIRFVDMIVELCKRELAFIWLTGENSCNGMPFMKSKIWDWRKKCWKTYTISLCVVWKENILWYWKNCILTEQRGKQMQIVIPLSGGGRSTIIWQSCWTRLIRFIRDIIPSCLKLVMIRSKNLHMHRCSLLLEWAKFVKCSVKTVNVNWPDIKTAKQFDDIGMLLTMERIMYFRLIRMDKPLRTSSKGSGMREKIMMRYSEIVSTERTVEAEKK